MDLNKLFAYQPTREGKERVDTNPHQLENTKWEDDLRSICRRLRLERIEKERVWGTPKSKFHK